jgi:hypothetical protein
MFWLFARTTDAKVRHRKYIGKTKLKSTFYRNSRSRFYHLFYKNVTFRGLSFRVRFFIDFSWFWLHFGHFWPPFWHHFPIKIDVISRRFCFIVFFSKNARLLSPRGCWKLGAPRSLPPVTPLCWTYVLNCNSITLVAFFPSSRAMFLN